MQTPQLQRVAVGLYVIAQFRPDKGVDHLGILDVGNRFRLEGLTHASEPVVAHLPPDGVRLDWLSVTGEWRIVRRVADEEGAQARLRKAYSKPNYSLFENNCEHFVEFIERGTPRSPQLRGVIVGLAAFAGLLFLATRDSAP